MEPVAKPKKKIYLVALTVLVFLVMTAGVIFLFCPKKTCLFQKSQTETASGDLAIFSESPPIEIFSLASVISRIDSEQKLIFVQHPTEPKEIKVMIGDQTEILKIEFPFDPANPPKGETTFSPKLTKITLGDLKPGNHALIESDENIYQKLEFNSVRKIQVLP